MTPKNTSITCDGCGEVYEFIETGTVDSMPDGELVDGNWYCWRCIRDRKDAPE